MRLLVLCMAVALAGCGPKPDPRPPVRRDPPRRVEPRRVIPRPPTLAGCPARPSSLLALPVHIREVADLGRGLRLIAAGQRASELPPCTGRCPAPEMVLALVAGDGTVCWRRSLPAEHRLGPVGLAGKTLWVTGPRQVFAVSWHGKLLARRAVDRPVLGPIALTDGGSAVVDGAGHMVVFRATGEQRWRRKPKTTQRPQAITPRPEGGLAVAFASEVRAYDTDGVRRLKIRLPESAQNRRIATHGTSTWVWSARGAYRVLRTPGGSGEGRIRYRLPSKAPADGRVFAAMVGPTGIFFAIAAERGFYPVKLMAVTTSDALSWTRPFTGSRPRGCRISTGPKSQLGIRCANGRAVVRSARGITRFDEKGKAPQVALGAAGRFAVAFEVRSKDMARICWVRFFGPASETADKQQRVPGTCGVLWLDGKGRVLLGAKRLWP